MADSDLSPLYDALRKADAAGNTADAQRLAQYIRTQSAGGAAPAAAPSGGYLKGAAESLGQVASGAIAQPIAGLAGLGAMAGRGMGLTQSDPADVVRQLQSALTYQPRTQEGQNISSAVGYLPGKFAQMAEGAGQKVSDATGSPLLGAATDTAIQGAPLILGARFLPG